MFYFLTYPLQNQSRFSIRFPRLWKLLLQYRHLQSGWILTEQTSFSRWAKSFLVVSGSFTSHSIFLLATSRSSPPGYAGSRDEILCWWWRVVTAQNWQIPKKIAFLFFPLGMKICTFILCNNPCDRKMPNHFSNYLKGLFWILSFLPSLAFAIFPWLHLCSPKQDILGFIMFCHDLDPCQFPWFYHVQKMWL